MTAMLRAPYTKYQKLHVYHLDPPVQASIDDQDLIGIWREHGTMVLFFHKNKDELVNNFCRARQTSLIYQAELDYSDWEAGHAIEPFSINGFTVSPAWEQKPADVSLDPSVVFGSGFHATTRFCLFSLLTILAAESHSPRLCYDLGCGTGLLSIAAAVKGCSKVMAYDYNELACLVSSANARRNKVADRIEVHNADLNAACPNLDGADIVVANLYTPLLVKLFQEEAFWGARHYILSGFLAAKEEELLCHFPDKLYRFVDRQSINKWGAWVLRRRDD